MGAIDIRRAVVADATRIGAAHVACWRESYADIVPAACLDALDATAFAKDWADMLAAGRLSVFVAEQSGEIAGFGSCGATRSKKLAAAGFDHEFWTLYLLGAAQGQGAGRRLMATMAADLQARGAVGAGVWMFEANHRARGFYEALGAQDVGIAGTWDGAGVPLADLALVWPDLAGLAHQQGDAGAPCMTSSIRARVARVVPSGRASAGKNAASAISKSGRRGPRTVKARTT